MRVDTDKCVGCGYCAWSCPYGAPQLNEQTGQMSKCDFCVDLRAKGEQPVCVATCPLEAIKFGPIDELRAKYGAVCDVKGLPDSSITKPNTVIKAHQGAERGNVMHELPLLILRCSCKDRLALRCGWRSEARNVARCCRLPERLCWRARGCLPPRCTWAIRLMLLTRCATYPAPAEP